MRQLSACRYCHEARFRRVFVMQVVTRSADVLPAVVLKLFEQIAVLHGNFEPR